MGSSLRLSHNGVKSLMERFMQRVSFREQHHRRVRLSSVSLKLIQGMQPREKRRAETTGVAEVISLMTVIRRRAMREVTGSLPTIQPDVPLFQKTPATVIRIPSQVEVEAYEEAYQPPQRQRTKKQEPLQLREALKAGRDFVMAEDILADYVRYVLKYDWGFRKFVSQRINRMLQGQPYISRACSRTVMRGMILSELRRAINDELRNDTETFQLNDEMSSGATAFRACHYGSDVRQPYFIMVNALRHEIVSLRLPGAFNQFKEYRTARQRSYRNDHGRRHREKSYLRLVR